MNTSEDVDNIVLKYFAKAEIQSVKTIGERLIVSLNTNEDKQKEDKLKQELQSCNPNKKIHIIFLTEKKENTAAEEKWQIKGVKHIIAVASGKGGVGKSTTTVNIAMALANLNLKVAVFDADIYGPSIPTMLGYKNMPVTSKDGVIMEPFKECGLTSMSIGSMIEEDQALIWRGAKACGAIQQLLTQTNWGDIDVMVLDMPPGTGDIQITMAQKIKMDGAIIVSTPQDIALIDAVKGINLFKKIGIPIIGVIENMSYYVCENCGHRVDIFGHAGAKETAQKYGVDFLGEIPLHYDIRANADNGVPIVLSAPESAHAKAYQNIAEKIAKKINSDKSN